MKPDFKRLVWKTFTKDNGIAVKVDALACLEANLSAFGSSIESEQDILAALNFVLSAFKAKCKERIILKEHIQSIMDNLRQDAQNLKLLQSGETNEIEIKRYTKIISAFDIPKSSRYCPLKGTWSHASSQSGGAGENHSFLEAEERIRIFRQRYESIKDRILRNDNFTTFCSESSGKFSLSTTNHLMGCSPEEKRIVFGMLSQLKEGVYFLEDLDGNVELNLEDVSCSTGVFTEGSFVVLEGFPTVEGKFKVFSIGLPPIESRKASKKHLGNFDFFSTEPQLHTNAGDDDESVLKAMEEQLIDAEFVFLFDLHLESKLVMQKFHALLDSLETKGSFPISIVICGPFRKIASSKYDPFAITMLSEQLSTLLLEIDLKYPMLCEKTDFIFLPSHEDPFPTLLLPKASLPMNVEKLKLERLRVTFSTNPCRIRFFTREFVVFRDDCMSRMQRNCIILPNQAHYDEQMCQTLLNQGHLSPFTMQVRPLAWQYEQSLSLFPLPDVVVLFDNCDAFNVSHSDCIMVNPSSFSKNEFIYLSYFPVLKQAIFNKVQ